METIKRRKILKAAGLSAAAISLPSSLAGAAERNKLVVGVIGVGGMGSAHAKALAARKDVEVTHVCDVDQNRLGKAVSIVASITGKKPQAVGDMRRIFDDRRVDAVFIATPDHWHAPASISALDAGKHVYVEKPCCHNIHEGRLLVDAVKRSGRRLQVGTQSRSGLFLKQAIQRLRDGHIGEVLVAKVWNSQRRSSIGKTEPSTPPTHLDFNAWIGPAPLVPYRTNMLHGIWRWWYDFGCGDIGNDGVHDIDVALWGLDANMHPITATCLGGKNFFDDDQQFPDTQYAVFEYPLEGKPTGRTRQLIFEQRTWSPYVQEGYENGVAFYGTKGILLIGHVTGWKLYGERNKLIAENTGHLTLNDHYDNFFACIRGQKKQLAADVLAGHRAATIVHLANIAARVKRVLRFDPDTEQLIGDDQANRLVGRRYRKDHWAVPANA